MLLYPIPESYHITAVKQDSVPAAGEITLLVIGDNRAVNAHDDFVTVLLTILFNVHVLPSFFETSRFRRSICQR